MCSGRSGGSSAIPLLASKLTIPADPPAMVDRPKPRAVLDEGTRGPVTLLSAPPGWGKTTLLSSWVRTSGADRPVAWVTLERTDEGDRFWSYLHAALSASGVSLPVPPVPGSAPDEDEVYLTLLADALTSLPRPVVLVLDDFHEVRDPGVPHGLEFLVRHAEKQLRLVLATRADPRLPLHRWRLRGELTELRTRELSFTGAETAELLAHEGQALDDIRLSRLQARTEGWPAGLRLAALSLRGCPDPDQFIDQLTGDHGDIADYLLDEVLSRQTPEVRDILLSSSVLAGMCGGLVDALTGLSGGEQVLAALEHANVFVVPLDGRGAGQGVGQGAGGGVWYRYHRMFGDFLFAELHQQAPERIRELHRRAASWYLAYGPRIQALRHALVAQDWTRATGVLVEHWPELVLCGRGEPLRTAVPAPPEDAMRAYPELALACATERLDLGDLHGASTYLRLADGNRHLLDENSENSENSENGENHGDRADRADRFALITAAFRLVEAQLGGDVAKVQSFAPQLLARAGTAAGEDTHSDVCVRAIALSALGTARLSVGDIDAAEEALVTGLAAAEHAGLSCPTLLCGGDLALLRAIRGELQIADRTARMVLATPPCPRRCHLVCNAHAYLALAGVHYQRDRMDDVEHYLGLAEQACDPAAAEPLLLALVTLLRTWLWQARGDLAQAYRTLLAGRRDFCDWTPPNYLEQWFAATEANLRTWYRDTAGARVLLAPLLEANRASAPLTLALARTYLRDDDPGTAVQVLRHWAEDRTAERILWLRLDGGLLEAVAVHGMGDPRQAHRMLEDVLCLAEPEDCRRIFTQHGTPLRKLLLDHLDSGTAHWSLLTELIEATEDRHTEDRHTGDLRTESADLTAVLCEPLSSRELTVLRYLQSMLSNSEIAAELCLSVHTVKTHVRNVYRKLGVSRRRDAVHRGRDLQLL